MWNGPNSSDSSRQQPDEQKTIPWLMAATIGATLLNTRERQQAVVTQLGLFALSTNNLDTLMNKALSLVTETLNAEYGKVLELLPGGREFRVRWGVGWNEGVVGHATVGTGTDSQAGYALLSHVGLLATDPVIVADLRTETRFNGSFLLCEHRVISGLSAVIPGTSRPFGVLGVHTTKRRRFTRDDANFVQAVANILSAAITRLEMERIMRENDTRLRLLVEQIPAVLWTTDAELRMTFARGAALQALALQPDQLIGTNLLEHVADASASETVLAHRRALAGHSSDYQVTHGGRTFQAYVEPLRDMAGAITGCIGVAIDISERARAEERSGYLLLELQDAQAKMKVLRGLLPICASCKNIRDDQGDWQHIENYICEHSEVQFSHGLCPDCFQRLYPDLVPDFAQRA